MKKEHNINQSFGILFMRDIFIHFFFFLKKLSLFLRKHQNISFLAYHINILKHFLRVKNRKSLKSYARKTYKIEYDFSLTHSCVGNRLDNKSSSKCLDGSIKILFFFPSIYEVHRVENLFATRKFIFSGAAMLCVDFNCEFKMMEKVIFLKESFVVKDEGVER